MENNKSILLVLVLFFYVVIVPVYSEYHTEGNLHSLHLKEQVTKLHFYLFDILGGNKPSVVEVARPNITIGSKINPFGHVYAMDDILKEGPNPDSKVIGNAQGLYMSSSQDDNLTLVLYADFGFTTGKYAGSSFSLFSRNPITETKRELAIVGGRGKFRLARGFVQVTTHYLNTTNGDAILEYNVTLLHY